MDLGKPMKGIVLLVLVVVVCFVLFFHSRIVHKIYTVLGGKGIDKSYGVLEIALIFIPLSSTLIAIT